MRNKEILKASLILFISIFFSRVLGFAREIIIAYKYGVSSETDAFYFAFAIPELLNKLLITGVLGAILIPIFTKLLNDNQETEVNKLYFVLRNLIMVFTGGISLIVFIFTKQIILQLAPNFNIETQELTISMLRILIFSTVFFSVSGLSKSFMQSHKVFGPSAIAPVLQNVIFVALIPVLSLYFGVYTLALSYLIAVIIQSFYQQFFVYKLTVSKTNQFSFKHKRIKFILITSIPALFTLALTDLNIILDRILSANFEAGSVSAITYANKIIQLPIGIIGASLIVALFPYITNSAQKNDFISVKKYLNQTIRIISIAVVPVNVVFYFFGKEIISLMFEYGAFSSTATSQTYELLKIYSLTIVFSIFILLFVRFFHSFQDVKTPMKIAFIMIAVKGGTSWIFGILYLSKGLAYSTLLTTLIGCLLLYVKINQKIDQKINSELMGELIPFYFKIFIANLIPLILCLQVMKFFDNFFFILILFFLIYLLICKMFKLSEINTMIKILKSKFKKKKVIKEI